MWAMIPMFRVCSSGKPGLVLVRRAAWAMVIGLPLEVAEGLVGLRHAVGVLATLDRRPHAVAGVDQLEGELLGHAAAVSLASGVDQPAHAQRDAPIGADLDRDLVGGTADALGLDLDERHGVAQRALHDLHSGAARALLALRDGALEDAGGELALAAAHQLVGELVEGQGGAGQLLFVLGLAGDGGTTGHGGFLALARRLGAVLGAALPPVANAGRVEGAAHDVVLHRGQVLDPAATHQDHGVLLQVVTDAGNVGGHLHLVRQAHARDLAKRRVRLLRGAGHHLKADTATLWGATPLGSGLLQGVEGPAQGGSLYLLDGRRAALADQLADRGQREPRGDSMMLLSLDSARWLVDCTPSPSARPHGGEGLWTVTEGARMGTHEGAPRAGHRTRSIRSLTLECQPSAARASASVWAVIRLDDAAGLDSRRDGRSTG